MRLMTILTGLALLLTLGGCSDGSNSSRQAPVEEAGPRLELAFETPPLTLPGISVDFARDVAYGDRERNRFDIYLPDCDDPTPLVIFIHGGGFTGGDKSAHERDGDWIQEILEACVAYAAINYTLLEVPGPDGDMAAAAAQGGVLTSLQDTARALQFMRYHHDSLNLDVENVALYGGSAGAGASLWLGTRDDMADPDSDDPVLRESTRVKAVGALATQATYDILDWEGILRPITSLVGLGDADIVTVAQVVQAENYLFTFLGVENAAQLDTEDSRAYRASVDMLELMDSGDAPIYVHNFATGFDDLLNMFLHHGLHALEVRDRAEAVGLHHVAYSEDTVHGFEDPSGEGLVSFLLRHIR